MLSIWRSIVKAGCVLVMLVGGYAQGAATVSHGDPLEPINRVVFTVNDALDAWVLKPVATGYDTVTPEPIQGLVENFFQNLGEVRNFTNALLQLELKEASVTTGRFLVNSTVGMLGMLDVGTAIGLDYHYQDFGLTLARWNVPSGPYVVLPFLGPRTLRSTVGIYPDMQLDPVSHLHDSKERLVLKAADVISLRAALLKQEGLVVGDKYTFIRDAYLQRRNYLITGEVPQDDF